MRKPQARLGPTLRARGLDLETYARLVPQVLECCATPGDARVLARQGQILRVGGSLRTDQLKYVATTAWLGHPFEEVDRAQALAWLAREYLRAFGPADFAWWSGTRLGASSMEVTTERRDPAQ